MLYVFLHFNNSRIKTCLYCCHNLLAIISALVVYKMPSISSTLAYEVGKFIFCCGS